MVRSTDRPAMTIAVDLGRKATKTNKTNKRVSNNLDPDQDKHFVGPDLGSNCLKSLSADHTGRQSLKV